MPDSAKYQLLSYTMQFLLEHGVEIAGPALLPCENTNSWETQKQLFPLLTAQNGLKRKQIINPKFTHLLFFSLLLSFQY